MKKLAMLMVAVSGLALAAGWDSVLRVAPEQKVEVQTKGETTRGAFVSASETAVVVRTKAGEHSIARAEVRKVRVSDPGKRVRNGLIGTGIGLAGGLALGFAVCPGCANEGHGSKFVAPIGAAGAGAGAAAGFLPSPYSTIYVSK